ncbi:RNA binding S1 domain protein [Desulforamulus reducens MI-1]|uniref:RNA binding S1 domain protein n=1 Tax=Desulforamulus reducens (strain ATCC BAA-1160 / DSM 100696 / MI-1) TaxID=349161 RepID=A4J2T0_DESRM|nr:RNA-binding protein S1 [Desulforamulus reducens]ABO49383.1 RNA binding S1 domain protein [Desulforamulus reducens MI-1]
MMYKPEGYVITADRWEQLHNARERKAAVEAVVDRVTWVSEIPVWMLDMGDGIIGMVPFGETGLDSKETMVRFVGQRIFVKVKGFDKDSKIVGCSRSEVIADAREMFYKKVKEGELVPAVVKAVLARTDEKPERLQVDVGGGFYVEVPRKDATRSQVLRLDELFPSGTSVRARVIQVDAENNRIRISLYDPQDPWETFDARRGDFLSGRVVKVVDDPIKLVFLEVKPGIVGIANLPQRGRLRKGDVVPVAVTMFSREKKKLHLRIKGARLA